MMIGRKNNFGNFLAALLTLHLLEYCEACNGGGGGGGQRTLGETRNLTFKSENWVADFSGCRSRSGGGSSGRCRRFRKQLLYFPVGTANYLFDFKQVTCYNKGVKDGKVKWRCSAPGVIKFPFCFGEIWVWCDEMDEESVNNQNLVVRHEKSCGLVFTVDFVVHPYLFFGAIGFIAGVLLMYGIYKKFYEPPPPPPQNINLDDINFDDDFDAWVWGTSSCRRMKRGPHSIAVTPTPAAGSSDGQEGGGDGDDGVILSRNETKTGAVIEDDNEAIPTARSSLIRLSSRTRSSASVTPFPSATSLANGGDGSFYVS